VSTVMTNKEALLKAIRENPDEDTPRLMYADEIEDEDPERANHIRHITSYVDHKTHQRWAGPFSRFWQVWNGPYLIPLEADSHSQHPLCVWDRGFIREVRCHGDQWVRDADEFLKLHPCNTVKLYTPATICNQFDEPAVTDDGRTVTTTYSWRTHCWGDTKDYTWEYGESKRAYQIGHWSITAEEVRRRAAFDGYCKRRWPDVKFDWSVWRPEISTVPTDWAVQFDASLRFLSTRPGLSQMDPDVTFTLVRDYPLFTFDDVNQDIGTVDAPHGDGVVRARCYLKSIDTDQAPTDTGRHYTFVAAPTKNVEVL
jgi:uncharacterized protein (TIGR02996 family)